MGMRAQQHKFSVSDLSWPLFGCQWNRLLEEELLDTYSDKKLWVDMEDYYNPVSYVVRVYLEMRLFTIDYDNTESPLNK